jgi:hypothetical protein
MSRTVFDNYEVESVKTVGGDIEVCEDDEAEFYSVYHRNEKGFADCVFDSNVRKAAEDHAEFLNKEDGVK